MPCGLPEASRFGPFLVVQTANGVSLDFDEIVGRIREWRVEYWADPGRRRPGEINHHFGGRGVYSPDPSGHRLEIIIRPYGAG